MDVDTFDADRGLGCRRAARARTDCLSGKEGTQMGAGLSCRPERRLRIRSRNSVVHQE